MQILLRVQNMQKRWGATCLETMTCTAIFFFFAIKKCTKGKMRHWNQAFRKEKPFGLNKKDADFSRFGTISPSGA
jgi:hypothetical protein